MVDLPNPLKSMVAGPRHDTNMTVEREWSVEVNSHEARFSGKRDVLPVIQEQSFQIEYLC